MSISDINTTMRKTLSYRFSLLILLCVLNTSGAEKTIITHSPLEQISKEIARNNGNDVAEFTRLDHLLLKECAIEAEAIDKCIDGDDLPGLKNHLARMADLTKYCIHLYGLSYSQFAELIANASYKHSFSNASEASTFNRENISNIINILSSMQRVVDLKDRRDEKLDKLSNAFIGAAYVAAFNKIYPSEISSLVKEIEEKEGPLLLKNISSGKFSGNIREDKLVRYGRSWNDTKLGAAADDIDEDMSQYTPASVAGIDDLLDAVSKQTGYWQKAKMGMLYMK